MQQAQFDWGQMLIDQAEDGSIRLTCENDHLLCCYELADFGSDEKFESPIRRFVIKHTGQDQVQLPQGDDRGRIDAAAYRGPLVKAYLTDTHQSGSLSARLAWQPIRGKVAEQELTIYQGKPWLRIDYLEWYVNIVDIALPGGTDQGAYCIYGAETWHRPYTYYEDIYFCRFPGDVGYRNITAVEDPAPLLYKDHFILGIYNPANGHGYGRVLPVEPVDIIKLLSEREKRGFEIFPCYQREHKPFYSYLFSVNGGAENVLSTGKQIIDEMERYHA